MEPKNKLYTRSYAIKRLNEVKFKTKIVDIQYNDARYWTIILNPDNHNIFITCYLNRENKQDFYFKLHSSRNTINIKTKSMLILIEGVNNLISEIDASC